MTPAVDIVEQPGAFEITAELPGMDEKNVEVKVVNGALVIKGEKHTEKEKSEGDVRVSERRFGAMSARSCCRTVSIPPRSKRLSPKAC